MQKKYYPYLDLLKFICCIGIVGIHTWPFYYAAGPLRDWFGRLCPVFVSIFFVVSSMLFWQKMEFNNNDWGKLGHFCKRLLILLGCWSILLLPHWLPKFIKHNPDDWYLWLVPQILTQGSAQGSWFIMALIYGTIICYLLNRYLNKHFVFALCAFIWLYFSLVKGQYINDFLCIYLQGSGDGFHLDSFYLPTRSIFWIEAAYYLLPKLKSENVPTAALAAISGGAILAEFFVGEYVFVLNTVIAICVPTICAKIASDVKNANYVFLRKMSIMIYFIHFIPVTVFHVLADKHLIPYEHGAIEFLLVFALASVCAGIIVWASNKYKILKYLY